MKKCDNYQLAKKSGGFLIEGDFWGDRRFQARRGRTASSTVCFLP
jgi:hypothetical protein